MAGARTPKVRAGELVPLAERAASLQILRVILASVAAGSVWMSDLVPAPRADLTLPTAGYLAITALVEVARRTRWGGGRALIGTMLLVDGLYLAWAMYATGGSGSPLRFLPLLHLIAVTTAGSYRTGLKIALWHSLLFFVVYYAQAGEVLRTVESTSATQFIRRAAVTVTTLWGVAIVTAAFSSLNERELRRRRRDLEKLTEMSEALDRAAGPSQMADILLTHVSAAFGLKRGVVLAAPSRRPPVLAALNASSRGRRRGRKADALVQRAWRERRTVLARAADPEADPRIASFLPDAANLLVVPMFAEGQPVATLILEHGGPRIQRRVVLAVERFAAHAALELRGAWLLERVRDLAATDPLTGVANRRTFHDLLDRDLARARRRGDPVTLVMLDIDHFKRLNDEHGHQVGDAALRKVAEAISSACRGSDVAARYGGEEFAVIMPDCSSRRSIEAAERLRAAIAGLDGVGPVTASAGTATFPTHAADAETLVRAADEALYESKREGRDRTTRSRKRAGRRSAGVSVAG